MSCSWNTWDLWLAISSYLGRFPRRRVATPWFLSAFPLRVINRCSPRVVRIDKIAFYLNVFSNIFRSLRIFVSQKGRILLRIEIILENFSFGLIDYILIGKFLRSRSFKATRACKWKVHPCDKISLRLVSFKTRWLNLGNIKILARTFDIVAVGKLLS